MVSKWITSRVFEALGGGAVVADRPFSDMSASGRERTADIISAEILPGASMENGAACLVP